MRVALYMDPPWIGGAERHFADLCDGLIATGIDVVIGCPEGPLPGYLQHRLPSARVDVLGPRPRFRNRLPGNLAKAALPAKRLSRWLRRTDAAIVHVCNGGYPGSQLARALVILSGPVTVMTVNNTALERQPMRHPLDSMKDSLMWRSIDAIICPSQATADRLISVRSAPRGLTSVVHYGIDPVPRDPANIANLRRNLGGPDDLIVGMVAAPDPTGDHAKHKGHEVLLEAFLAAQCDRLRLVVVGHDPGDVFRSRAHAAGVADRVILHTGHRDTAPYMHAIDLLAVPSTKNEALPLVILEALSAGTPVLASRLSGIPEAIEDGVNGHLVPPGDAAAMARFLARLVQNQAELTNLSDGARRRWSQLFSRDRMVANTLATYERAMEVASLHRQHVGPKTDAAG